LRSQKPLPEYQKARGKSTGGGRAFHFVGGEAVRARVTANADYPESRLIRL
jgi:hypothetical protein